jgi:hypothetical protein
MIVEALKSLGITTEFLVDSDAITEEQYIKSFKDLTNQNRFFEWSVVSAKIAELQAAEPMRLLRIERDRLIQQTDWWVLPDRTATPAQLSYRQALRDLPANSTPTLDENGNLTGVEWPVYSEEA